MKALGITTMIFSIVAIFTPIIGPYLTFVCALLAAFSAGPGVTFGLVAIGINIINIVFLSPTLWVAVGLAAMSQKSGGGSVFAEAGTMFVGAQIIAAIVLMYVHSSWKKKHENSLPLGASIHGSANEQQAAIAQSENESTGGSPEMKALTNLWESGSISENEYRKRAEELDVTGALRIIKGLWEAGTISEGEYKKRKARLTKGKN